MNKLHADQFLPDYWQPELHRAVEDGLFFAPWTGDVRQERRNNVDGTTQWVITGVSGSVVERVNGMWEVGADKAKMAMILPLEEAPLAGNAYYPGTGEKLRYKWRSLFVNQWGKVVSVENGLMNLLRTKKIEKEKENATPELIQFARKWKNLEFVSTLYEGHSYSTTLGTNTAPEGIGAVKVIHPNLYTNTVDPSSGGTLTAIGTEYKNKLTTDLDTALSTNYANLKYPSEKYLDKVGEKLDELGIQKFASWKGIPKWLCVIQRNTLSHLKQNTVLRNDFNQAFMGKEYDNPLFKHDAWVVGEFLFALDKKVARSWDDSTNDFAGKNGYIGNPTYHSTYAHSFMWVLGGNALGYSNAFPMSLIPDSDNFGLQKETLAVTVMGAGRGEFVSATDYAAYFASGNASASYLGSAKEVKNQSSAGFAVKLG